jgi:diguanylate cyclase (GGDEF)-like protein
LTVRYLLALGFLAFLTVLVQASIQQTLHQREDEARTINLAGRQRMLTLSMTKDLLAFPALSDEGERARLVARLKENLAQWDLVHQGLVQGDPKLGLGGLRGSGTARLFAELDPIRARLRDRLAEGIAFCSMTRAAPQPNNMTEVLDLTESFVAVMDRIVDQYTLEAEQRLRRFRFFELGVMTLILVVLGLEILFIFRPLARKLRRTAGSLETAMAELGRLSRRDGLTGVYNRRAFDEQLGDEWRRASRNHKPVSIILLDVDLFKEFNDTFGHQAGDRALIQVAQAVQARAERVTDTVARYGGEEFVVLMPGTDAIGAQKVAEDIRGTVENLNIPHTGSGAGDRLTVSLGLACRIPEKNPDPAGLVQAADQALYLAKNRGRNQVAVFEPSPGVTEKEPCG